ncbi:isochorismatase family cysteine hydrolase [Mesorhizobium sp. VK23B]|uniref:Isochorismatase family cysteine hydrolase n=1 Tax=Mesorhizobium dulcispinae TaxID=3072316 RepID=A0ABU4XP61_9HYPH|nr:MULTISPECIES: isochorismatase family cysteine hydrolase [unclassified Mesorhizobium]MDX8469722.1 isochorismatase family cysteine hydrolase [Mesorhizobium sp. VK23B]MDX8476061.1 isochorismatase family cysteine hydrolase [Mesorhizobium sp. VK23A]
MSESEVFAKVLKAIEFDVLPEKTALVIVDMQYLDAHWDYGMGAEAKRLGVTDRYQYYFQQVEQVVIPNIQKLLEVCRKAGIQVIYPRIASLVKDCRDVSIEHKRLNLLAPVNSRESEILDEIKPLENEIVLSKGASGVFNSTAIDQILRNLGVDTLIITGVNTNYCVETAVRDAGDRGYNVVLVSDACAAMSEEHQRHALEILPAAYCVVKDTDQVVHEIRGGLRQVVSAKRG